MKKRLGVATASQVFLTFLTALASILGLGFLLGRSGLPIEVAMLLIPAATLVIAVGAIRVFRLRPYPVFLLRPARLSDLLLSAPVALGLFVVSDQLANLAQQVMPLDPAFLESLNQMIRADGFIEWGIRLAGVCVGAAVSEELLFRGVIQTGLHRLGRAGAICVTALLFTVMHGLILPNYFVAGVVLGIAAAATGSILVPIAIHFFHNAAALLLFNLADLDTLGEPVWTPPGILVPALGILAIVLTVWVRRMQRTSPPPGVAPDFPPPPPEALSIGDDLKRVSVGRRRLGLLVLGTAAAGGVCLSLGLFGFLGYIVDPGGQRAAAIQQLRQLSHDALRPDADRRGEEIDAAFDTLGDLNRDGRLGILDVWRAARAIADATSDGDFGDRDVEDLLTVVGGIRRGAPAAGPG